MLKSKTTLAKTSVKTAAKAEMETDAPSNSLRLILEARHHDPFNFLGLHIVGDAYTYRTFLPNASEVKVNTGSTWAKLDKTHADGLFEWHGETALTPPCLLKVTSGENDYETYDPYTFTSSLTQDELYLFGEGRLMLAYKTLGAQCITQDNIVGVRFAVWAPNAERVSVTGSFNNWDGRIHSMRCLLYTSRCV